MNPLFIHGYSKSGTSLLVALLDGHPNINVIPEEADYFDGTFFLVEKLAGSSKLGLKEKLEILYNQMTESTHLSNFFAGISEDDPRGNFDYRDFDGKSFEKTFKSYLIETGLSHGNVFEALARAYSAGIGKAPTQKYWLEKTPYHDLNVKNRETILNTHFDNYKVIHIFRDPRDNYLAYGKKRPELSIYDICYEWKRIVNLALGWSQKEKNLIIRYEDLVLKTEVTMNQILSFLNLEASPKIYEPTKNGIPWLGNSMFGQKSAKISSDRVNRYMKLMDEETKKIIETHCSEEMMKLEYEPSTNRAALFSPSYQFAKVKSFFKLKSKFLRIRTVLNYKY